MIPNTTPTPNIIFNGLMRKMNDTEFRIVMLVVRATLGWEADKETGLRKTEDWISSSQLELKTGRRRSSLSPAINKCIQENWIEARSKNGDILDTAGKRKGKNLYFRLGKAILFDCSESGQVMIKDKKDYQTCPVFGQQPVQKVQMQNLDTTKEIHIQNKLITKDTAETAEWDFKKYLEGMEENKRRDLQIIALYWKFKKFSFTNKKQAEVEIRRSLRASKDLVPYEDDKIWKTIEWLAKNAKFKWTLESCIKYINEKLSDLKIN